MAKSTVIERTVVIASVYVSAVILLGVLIGLWRYGIDLSAVFLGTHWNSTLPQTRGTIAIEGGLVFITLGFGGLLVFGLMALIKEKLNRKPSPAKTE